MVQFHCAFIRYEKGLSVEEIWSEAGSKREIETDAANTHSQTDIANKNDEESVELTFEADENNSNDEDEIESVLKEDESNDKVDASNMESSRKSPIGNYEMVDKVKHNMVGSGGDDDDDGGGDLDDLDAEIAKELAELDDI